MPLLAAFIAVILLNVYAAVLIWLRAVVYRVALYRPMLLNIVLSFVPVVVAVLGIIGLLLIGTAGSLVNAPSVVSTILWVYLIVGTIAWILFFPNAIYLITELNFSHRREDDPVPLWFDIVQTLTLTLSGIANAVLSMGVMEFAFTTVILDPAHGTPVLSWVFAGVVIVLGAVGVYFGRYLRFNSWDVRHPIGMLRKLRAHFAIKGKALEAFGFVLTHAVLIALVFVPLYLLAYAALRAG
ncbi:DUF1361 domain-containing protein [Microbacterium horticulturae]|uniref:DUF1361 domain-containing protein n=1 Tax=Microbacterium horticulturae TaxID=3028316 RepID=A0ABY8C556_9MICO|nr:DUF1361 domain-containing protein [Microbacterium sp. KACC 23027]WEG09768.1 DUF1361 domain-containing protein [Microbacterium sp. KACC 23027]